MRCIQMKRCLELNTSWLRIGFFLTHTEVPKSMEGKGLGSAIVKLALEDIEQKGLTLVPLCPFVALYLKRHPEWKRLVMKGINIE